MSIKVIIMDVDGTLTNNQKIVTPKTKEALLKAEEKGAILILASGRPTSGLIDLAKELKMDKHHGLLVAYNGSKVIDCETKEVLFNQALSIEEGKAVLEHMKKFDKVRPMIDRDEYMFVNNVYDNWITWKGKPFDVIQYESRGGKFKLCEIEDLAAFVDFPLNKILTIDAEASAISMLWTYIGELIFNMLVLVGTVKMSDRVVKDMMGL